MVFFEFLLNILLCKVYWLHWRTDEVAKFILSNKSNFPSLKALKNGPFSILSSAGISGASFKKYLLFNGNGFSSSFMYFGSKALGSFSFSFFWFWYYNCWIFWWVTFLF